MQTASSEHDQTQAKLDELESCVQGLLGGIEFDYLREWTILKFKQLQEQSRPESLYSEIKAQQEEASEASARRFAELAAEIDQLRLQTRTNTPSSSSVASITPTMTPLTTNLLPLRDQFSLDFSPQTKSFFFFGSRNYLPTLRSTSIEDIYQFFAQLEREFKLRNYELQLPADNTDGWARYALMQLGEAVGTLAMLKLDASVSPNSSWGAFKRSIMNNFITDNAIQKLEREYTKLDCNPNLGNGCISSNDGNISILNGRFRYLRLLMAFVGKDIPEETAVKHYVKKVANNVKVALALAQFVTAERIIERSPSSMGLEEVMDYCEKMDNTYRVADTYE